MLSANEMITPPLMLPVGLQWCDWIRMTRSDCAPSPDMLHADVLIESHRISSVPNLKISPRMVS